MTLTLHGHPFSSYCQKALTALYENATPFTLHRLDLQEDDAAAAFRALWPMERMPVLVDGDTVVVESSIIVEHLDLHHPGPVRLVPADAGAALAVRMMDRFFDNYVMTPMQQIVFNAIRPEADRDPYGVAQARRLLEKAYGWLDASLAGKEWAAGPFSLADCAAAPALFYADWTYRIADSYPRLRAYRARLLARPSFARAVDEARPYRPLFPLGAPARD